MAYCDHVRGMRRALPFLILLLVAAAPAQAQGLDRHSPQLGDEGARARPAARRRARRRGRAASSPPPCSSVAAQRSDLTSDAARAGRPAARAADRSDGRRRVGRPLTGCDGREGLHGRPLLHPLGGDDERRPAPRRTRTRQRPPDYIDDMIGELRALLRRREHAARLDRAASRTAPAAATPRPTSTSRTSATTTSTATRARDPGQTGRSRFAYLVMDDDYATSEFPDYDGPAAADAGHRGARVQPRAAVRLRRLPGHLDVRVDGDLVGGEGLRRRQRLRLLPRLLGRGARRADHVPRRRRSAQLRRPEDVRLGDLEPLDRRALRAGGRSAGRGRSRRPTPSRGGGFAPRAYDKAIQHEGGPGFATELATSPRPRRSGTPPTAASTRASDVPRRGRCARAP